MKLNLAYFLILLFYLCEIKNKMPTKIHFQESWLSDRRFVEWIAGSNSKENAQCKLCKCVMGYWCYFMVKWQWEEGLAWKTKLLMLTCTKYQLLRINWSWTISTVIVFCHSHCQSQTVCRNQWDALDKDTKSP